MEVLGAIALVLIFVELVGGKSAAGSPQQTLFYAQNNRDLRGNPLPVPQTVDSSPLISLTDPLIPRETLTDLPVSAFSPTAPQNNWQTIYANDPGQPPSTWKTIYADDYNG